MRKCVDFQTKEVESYLEDVYAGRNTVDEFEDFFLAATQFDTGVRTGRILASLTSSVGEPDMERRRILRQDLGGAI